MGKSRKQTITGGIDPASQTYVDRMRQQAMRGGVAAALGGGPMFTGPLTASIADQAAPFFNPYQDQVIGGITSHYDQLRSKALVDANQQAAQAGAFGGSRHGIMAGARLGELDTAEAQQVGGLLYGGYNDAVDRGTAYAEHQRQLSERVMQEPLWRQQQALQFMNMGMGPTGYTQTTRQPGNLVGDLAGLGLVAGGFFAGGPAGAAAGASAAGAMNGGGMTPGPGTQGLMMPQFGTSDWRFR